jgi:hypothetical protein
MAREDDALARRTAREARRAAMRAVKHSEDEDTGTREDGDGNGSPDPIRAAREAATAAAVGAAVGAMKALTARRHDEEPDEATPSEDGEDDFTSEPEDDEEPPEAESQPTTNRDADRERNGARSREAASGEQVARMLQAAREQLRVLNGADAETVSSFARTRDGWRVTLEVVEVRRIPETTDVLASYAIELDDDGGLVAYERIRRYQRSEALGE